jgi:hypothetical protein
MPKQPLVGWQTHNERMDELGWLLVKWTALFKAYPDQLPRYREEFVELLSNVGGHVTVLIHAVVADGHADEEPPITPNLLHLSRPNGQR